MPADARPGETVFVDRLHQPGPLTILGKVYDQPGAKQAEAVLRDLAVHPATARHVATKLARHFSGDEPPATLVDRLAKDFERTGGDLSSLYRTLVASPEPSAATPAMLQPPWDWPSSDEGRVGKECVSTCMSRWARSPSKKKKKNTQ